MCDHIVNTSDSVLQMGVSLTKMIVGVGRECQCVRIGVNLLLTYSIMNATFTTPVCTENEITQ